MGAVRNNPDYDTLRTIDIGCKDQDAIKLMRDADARRKSDEFGPEAKRTREDVQTHGVHGVTGGVWGRSPQGLTSPSRDG